MPSLIKITSMLFLLISGNAALKTRQSEQQNSILKVEFCPISDCVSEELLKKPGNIQPAHYCEPYNTHLAELERQIEEAQKTLTSLKKQKDIVKLHAENGLVPCKKQSRNNIF